MTGFLIPGNKTKDFLDLLDAFKEDSTLNLETFGEELGSGDKERTNPDETKNQLIQ